MADRLSGILSMPLFPPRVRDSEPTPQTDSPFETRDLPSTWNLTIESPSGGITRCLVPEGRETFFLHDVRNGNGFEIRHVRSVSLPVPRPGATISTPEGYRITNSTFSEYDRFSGPHTHNSTGPHTHNSTGFSSKQLINALKDKVEIRTRAVLDGSELSIRTQLVILDMDKETIISEDEDSVDLTELLDRL